MATHTCWSSMKFGRDIQKHVETSKVDPSWYVDYRGLKKLISSGCTEAEFQSAFQAELEKVKAHTWDVSVRSSVPQTNYHQCRHYPSTRSTGR